MLNQDKVLSILEEIQFNLTHWDCWCLGIAAGMELDEDTREERLEKVTKTFTTLDELEEIINPDILNQGAWIRILIAHKYHELLQQQGKQLLPNAAKTAWVEGKLYTSIQPISNALECELIQQPEEIEDLPEGACVIGDFKVSKPELKEKGISILRTTDLAWNSYITLDSTSWGKFFSSLAMMRDEEEDDIFCLPSLGYMVWMKWNEDDFHFHNPEYYPRNLYWVTGIGEHPFLVSREDVWGNFLLSLIRGGLTRDSFGSLLRVRATDLVVPIQVYGNKSSYNLEVEFSKPGILVVEANYHKGINFSWYNCDDQYAVAACYELLNSKGIVNFPQHQGEDLRTDMAALGAGISLVKYHGVSFYVVERNVDKITKLFNRCALANRVGTKGSIKF